MDWRLARESRYLFRLAIPLSLTTFAQLAITTTNLIYLGALGAEDLAAATWDACEDREGKESP